MGKTESIWKKPNYEEIIKSNSNNGYATAIGASSGNNSAAANGTPELYSGGTQNSGVDKKTSGYLGYLGNLLNTAKTGVVNFVKNGADAIRDFKERRNESEEDGGIAVAAPATEQPYSYGQYLADAEKNLGEYTAYLKELAESEKTDAMKAAEDEFQRASIDANAAYQRNLATYGAKGEALQRMGLTGSGYSDYLQGKAYSDMRSDVGLATSEKNAAEQAANKGYMNALREAEMYKSQKLNELNAEKGTYYDNLQKDAETKKQTAMTQAMSMAQQGADINTINAYLTSSGIILNGEEREALESLVGARTDAMKAELIAQAITGGYNMETINAIANAAGVTLSENDITDITTAIDKINADAKTEEDRGKAFNILTTILSQEGGISSVDKSTVEALIKTYGLDPTTGVGADIMKLYGGASEEGTNTGYEGGVVDSNNSGKILSGATAKKGNGGGEGEGGNVTIKLNNKDYHLQRVDESPVKNSLETKLNDSFRLANNYSVEQWKQLPEEDIKGSVMYYNGKLYAYLESKNGKYGWFELENRPLGDLVTAITGALGGNSSTDYDKLVRKAKNVGKTEEEILAEFEKKYFPFGN